MLRLISFTGVVAAALGLVAWQAPEWLPADLAAISESASVSVAGLKVPVWASFGAAVLLASVVGFFAVNGRSSGVKSKFEPRWLEQARILAPKTRFARDYLRNVDALEKKLAADIEYRGRAALARAHQMDLYWRFVGRNRTSRDGSASGQQYQRWVSTSRAALRAVALAPEARLLSSYQLSKSILNQVGGPAAKDVGAFYGELSERFGQYEAAWLQAYAELAKPVVNRDTVLVSMEKLRRINRQIAEDSARLHGPIEISIRSVN